MWCAVLNFAAPFICITATFPRTAFRVVRIADIRYGGDDPHPGELNGGSFAGLKDPAFFSADDRNTWLGTGAGDSGLVHRIVVGTFKRDRDHQKMNQCPLGFRTVTIRVL